jgi:hypothetical protein
MDPLAGISKGTQPLGITIEKFTKKLFRGDAHPREQDLIWRLRYTPAKVKKIE